MNYWQQYVQAHDRALGGLEVTDASGGGIEPDAGFAWWCEWTASVQESGRQQFLVGNGASASFANHMALDWIKNGGVPTQSVANPAVLTALGNDLGFDEVFAVALGWYGRPGDLLVTISSSGNSPNILRTIEKGREIGTRVVTLSGLRPDNASRRLGDLNFYIPAKTYGIVECAHQVLLHLWLDRFMGIAEWDKTEEQNMRRGEFRL